MNETRRHRLESIMLQELSLLISREVKDPRVPNITITRIQVTEDAESADIHFMLFGADATDEEIKECSRGLSSSSPFLRRSLARILNIRHIPELHFKADRGLENAARVSALLEKIKEEPKLESKDNEPKDGRGTPRQ